MKEMAETLVRTLVDNPDQVSVSAIAGEQSSLVEIRVSKTDLGQVIGRAGHTVEALRTILSSVAAKDKKRVLLDVIE
jgi:predicted RNA-binding protein YlqC (UPF0109 family)